MPTLKCTKKLTAGGWADCRELLYLRRHPDLFYSRLLVQVAMGFVMGTLRSILIHLFTFITIFVYYYIFLILDNNFC